MSDENDRAVAEAPERRSGFEGLEDERRLRAYAFGVIDRQVNRGLRSRRWDRLDHGKVRIAICIEGNAQCEGLLDGALVHVKMKVFTNNDVRQALRYVLQSYCSWHQVERDGIEPASKFRAYGDVFYLLVPTDLRDVRTPAF